MAERRVAVLVDGDNVGARHSARILAEAGALGRIDVARVYVAGQQPSDWLNTPGYWAVQAGAGKNAADLLLSIDAMELALDGGLEAFAIATSDRDYTYLAHRLRGRGLHVLGLGERKAPDAFRLACTAFCGLDCAQADPMPVAAAVTSFDLTIRTMIARDSRGGRGMLISDLSRKMHAEHATRISTRPERTWRAYLSARPALYQIDPRGPDAMVRFDPRGFA